MRRLQQLGRATGHLLDLVGSGCLHHYRLLHPAYQQRNGERINLRWAEVAAKRNEQVDLSVAEWHDVSGYRLHTHKTIHTVDEPLVGPTSMVLRPVLDTISDCREVKDVTLAEWTGYDEELAERHLEGSVRDGLRQIGHLEYSVWHMGIAQAMKLIAADRIFRCPDDQVVLANYIWDATEDWLVAADGDLASTYVATQFPITEWPPELEWVEVPEDAPLG